MPMGPVRDLQERMRTQMRLAFFDRLEQSMSTDPEMATDWLERLHREMSARFAAILPSRASEIREKVFQCNISLFNVL